MCWLLGSCSLWIRASLEELGSSRRDARLACLSHSRPRRRGPPHVCRALTTAWRGGSRGSGEGGGGGCKLRGRGGATTSPSIPRAPPLPAEVTVTWTGDILFGRRPRGTACFRGPERWKCFPDVDRGRFKTTLEFVSTENPCTTFPCFNIWSDIFLKNLSETISPHPHLPAAKTLKRGR